MVPPSDIAQWRLHVFSRLLPVVLLLGGLAAVPSAAVALRQGMWPVAVLDLVALGWIFAVWRLERAPYHLRVLHFLGVLFVVALGLMAAIGPVSLNYLMAPPIVAVILLGNRAGLTALALGTAAIVVFGMAGFARLYVPGLEADPLVASLVVALNFACVGALVTFTSGTLLEGLSRSLFEVRTAAVELVAGQARLQALNDELRLTSEAVARLNDMVLIARCVDELAPDADAHAEPPIIFANDAFLRHTGFAREEIVGHGVGKLHGADTDPATVAIMQQALARKEPVTAELLNYTRRGVPFWVEVEMAPFAGDSGAITHWVMVGRDVTERRNAADAIHRLAHYDVLTGLPNRRLLMERLAQMVDRAQAGETMGAVLYVDLDHFKTINDARGHAVGDHLLRHAAGCMRAAVGHQGCVARLGGDEFVVLLADLGMNACTALERALALAETIRGALAEKVVIDEQRYYTSASIGVTLATRSPSSSTVPDLLREADTAMFHAKTRGRNGVAQFEAGMLADAERRLTLEHELGNAFEQGELALHLQLQVDAAHAPCGAELLMRWRRRDGSSVPPDVFIPIAESSGMIVALGEWALRQACLAWHALARAGSALPLSVNVSPVQFRQTDFVARVQAILVETGVPPGQLIFEVTEGLLVDRLDQTIDRMHELAALGIRISVDDFGTGYSSLAYLTRMPLYELKIDKSFISVTPHDKNGTAIVQSILAMAGHLGLRVVAEGVETQAQAAYLAQHGNACMQGNLFCQPMPLASLLTQLHPDRHAAA